METTPQHVIEARREAARRTEAFAARKNAEARAAIVARGGTLPVTDWAAIAADLRASGRIS